MSDFVMPLRGSVIGRPVFCNADRTWETVAVGFADLSTAQAPATCGVAIEVPLAVPNPPGTYASGREEVTEPPGASRLKKLALLEKLEMVLSLFVEPTLIAEEMQPGAVSEFVLPLLPEAMAVAILALRRLSMTVF